MKSEWLFPASVAEAKRVQKELAARVQLQDSFPQKISYITGLDVSNNPFDPEKMIYASAVTLSYPELVPIESSSTAEKQPFPYISGLLGFREAPALIHAVNQLKIRPDILMVDGHGVAHPRKLGIASHVGVLLDIPTIGVAKSILVGASTENLSDEPGSHIPLIWKGETIAAVVRTKKRCTPLIISPGHRITLKTAVSLVLSCIRGYRLSEPTRLAHLASNAHRIAHK